MNKTIKTLIIIIVSVLILGVAFWLITKPIRADKTRKQDILNFLNGKSFNNISKESKDVYKEITKLEKDETYNVSDLVVDYMSKVRQSLTFKKNNPLEISFKVKTKVKDSSNNALVKSYLSNNCSAYLNRFSEDDIKIAGTEQFGNKLVKELEKIITHKEKYSASGWFIDQDCLKNSKLVEEGSYQFDLPYETYLTYTKRKVSLTNNKFIDCSLKKLAENNYEITLKDDSGKTFTTYMTFDHKDSWFHKRDMTINIYDLTAVYSPARISIYTDEPMERISENTSPEELEPLEEDGLIFEKNLYY